LNVGPAALAAIFLGGALGTVARFLLDTARPAAPGHFPLTTLVINLSGSLAIGILIPLLTHLGGRWISARPFLVVGVLGGWTTYSTLTVDAVQLAHHGHVGTMALYLAATVLGGIVAVLIGQSAVTRVVTP
jgi:CrcB protein